MSKQEIQKLDFEIDGKKVSGQAAFANGTLWVHLDGETFAIESEKRQGRRGSKGAGGGSPGQINAPMPGKIVKVLVKKGELVQAHQVLLMMEAMKMEYTLKAQAAGRVTEIHCEAGQQVALGQTLAKVEAE